MMAASSDLINGFVHIEGKEISLGDNLQLVAERVAEVDVYSRQETVEDLARDDVTPSGRH